MTMKNAKQVLLSSTATTLADDASAAGTVEWLLRTPQSS